MTFEFTIGSTTCQIGLEDARKLFGRHIRLISGGYLAVAIGRKERLLHRYLMGLGLEDTAEVDHINGNRADNRRCNLRLATKSQNGANQKLRPDNETGVTGLWWDARRERWCASIGANRKKIPLGRFIRREDAIAARRAAEDKYHGSFAARHGAQRDQP